MIQSPCRRAMASVSTISSRVAMKPGRIAGEFKKDEFRCWPHRLFELGRIETPAAPFVEPDGHGARSGDFQRADKIGPGGRGYQRLVAGADDEAGRDLPPVHSPPLHKKNTGRENAPPPAR